MPDMIIPLRGPAIAADRYSGSYGVRPYRAWMLQISRYRIHEAVDLMDAQKRGGRVLTRPFSSWESIADVLPPGTTTPSRLASHREQAERMRAALTNLHADRKPIVFSYLFEGLTMEEVAEQLDIGLSAAWYRFRRGSEEYARALRNLNSGAESNGLPM